jgi:hypothetical protein
MRTLAFLKAAISDGSSAASRIEIKEREVEVEGEE